MGTMEKKRGAIRTKMEEDIKLVENLIKEFETYNDLDGIQDLKTYMKAIENLIKGYRELEEENKRLKGKIDVCDWQEKSCREIVDEKYMPVSLVKEKIEELDKKINDIPDNEGNFSKAILIRTKITLQELLEDK